MRLARPLVATALLSLTLPCLATGHLRRGPTSQHLFRKRSPSHIASRPVGQRAMDDSRATEIQTALAGAGYLSGEPSGHWDANTEVAMQRFQSDNGWQTRLMPDSRAIIKLGLGPKQTSFAQGQLTGAEAAAPAVPSGSAIPALR